MALYSWPTEWVFVGKRVQSDEGRFAEQTSDEDILRVIRASEFPAVTAQWVANTVEMERLPCNTINLNCLRITLIRYETILKHRHCLDKDEQVKELVIDATLKPAQKEFRHGYA